MSRMLVVLSVAAFTLPSAGCCDDWAGGRVPDGARTEPEGKLEGVTADTMAANARREGFTVREEVTEREELPGAILYRLTLDHDSKGTAFVDLYDLTDVSAHTANAAVEVGKTKTIYLAAPHSPVSSRELLADLLRATSIAELSRRSIEKHLRDENWTLGDSSRFKDDISGQHIVDVAAHRGESSLMIVLLDYARVAAGEEQAAMRIDERRLLFVDMIKRRWSQDLLKKLVN